MEHRCSVRKPLTCQLVIYKHGIPVQSGIARNLGLGGVFIDTGKYPWRKNEYVEIEFVSRNDCPRMRLPAVVVHYSARGAGLMFDSISSEQALNLRTWLLQDTAGPEQQDTRRREVA
jgi:hypothetical protein